MGGKGESEFLAILVEQQGPSPEPPTVLVVRSKSHGSEATSSSDLWEIPSRPLPAAGPNHGEGERVLQGGEGDAPTAVDVIGRDLAILGWVAPAVSETVESFWQATWAALPSAGGAGIIASTPPQPQIAAAQPRRWLLQRDPPFGPGPAPLTAVLTAVAVATGGEPASAASSRDDASWRWLSLREALAMMASRDADSPRVGPLTFRALWARRPREELEPDTSLLKWGGGTNHDNVPMMEYPAGFFLVPMDSNTLPPFRKTNLGVFMPAKDEDRWRAGEPPPPTRGEPDEDAAVSADCLLIDPGCCGREAPAHLSAIMLALGRRRIAVFVTHHHDDHVAALPVVRHEAMAAGTAILVGHPDTLSRIPKRLRGDLPETYVTGGEKLRIAGRDVKVVAAPGHTSGHLALFDSLTRVLVVGDHCVGQGSAILDADSGGDMQEYLNTTDKMLAMKPRVIYPMHGRPSFWPIEMLQGYKKHRLEREAKILAAVQGGARSAYEVVSAAYADTAPALWPAALKNATLHVKRLASLGQLPKEFSVESFHQSAGVGFHLRCLPAAAGLAFRKFTSSMGT